MSKKHDPITDLKVGDVVRDHYSFTHDDTRFDLIIQDVSHAEEGLYWGGYIGDMMPWGSAAPKRHVRIDTDYEHFVKLPAVKKDVDNISTGEDHRYARYLEMIDVWRRRHNMTRAQVASVFTENGPDDWRSLFEWAEASMFLQRLLHEEE